MINSDELEPRDFFFRIKFFDHFQNRKLFFTIYFNFEQILYDKNIKQNCYTIIIVFSIILLKEKLYNIYFIEIFYKNFQKNSKWYKLEYVIHILHIIFHTSKKNSSKLKFQWKFIKWDNYQSCNLISKTKFGKIGIFIRIKFFS